MLGALIILLEKGNKRQGNRLKVYVVTICGDLSVYLLRTILAVLTACLKGSKHPEPHRHQQW